MPNRTSFWIRLTILIVIGGWAFGAGFRGPRAATTLLPAAPLTHIQNAGDRIALTFDVTYGEKQVQTIAQILQTNGVTATFFVSHLWAANHPQTLQSLVAQGHEIGSLGYKLVDQTALTPAEMTAHLTHAQGLLFRILSEPVRLFRPPLGRWNSALIEAAREVGMHTVTWEIDGGDGVLPSPPPAAIARPIVALAEPGDIVRLHASDFSLNTAAALPQIIEHARKRGIKLVSVRELVE